MSNNNGSSTRLRSGRFSKPGSQCAHIECLIYVTIGIDIVGEASVQLRGDLKSRAGLI
jgi:hypothetical protein